MKPRNIKQLQQQSKRLRVRRVGKHTLVVESVSNPIANHIVTVTFGPDHTIHARCTCEWAINRGVACSHVMAALDYLASTKQRKLSFWRDRSDAERQKHRLFYLSGGSDDGVWITSRTA